MELLHTMKKQLVLSFIAIMTAPMIGASYLMLTDLGSSAEMIRRGNIEGFSHGANAIFENPASVYTIKYVSLSAFTTQIMNEVEYKNVAATLATDYGRFSVGYMDAGVDDIYLTTKNERGMIEQGGTFSYKNRLMKVGYQGSISDQFHVGIAGVVYVNEMHTYIGTGYSMDAGIMYLLDNLHISFFGRNLIPAKVEYTNSDDESYSGYEDLPTQVVLALKYPIWDLNIFGQTKFDGTNTLIGGGIEFTPSILAKLLTLSVGYKEYSVLDSIGNNITFGAGLNLFGVSVDYAYEASEHFEYDGNNYASISFDF